MGKVIRELASRVCNGPVTWFPDRAVLELNGDDSIHLHYRNHRFEFSRREFEEFASLFSEAQQALQAGSARDADDGRDEIESGYWVLAERAISSTSDLQAVVDCIELNEALPGFDSPAIHVHTKNLRTELSVAELRAFFALLLSAIKTLDGDSGPC